MRTLKEIILVKLAADLINDSSIRKIMKQFNDETWKNTIRRRLSAFDIPLTLKEEVIDLMKPIAVEVNMWEVDHNSIFTTRQKRSLKFCFHADGTVDRVKTADSLIHSEVLDVQTRFLLACQYWSSYDILNFFKKVRKNTRNRILRKYSKEKHNLNEHQKNVVKWVEHYRAGSPSRRWAIWTLPSLQSRRLDDVSRKECERILNRLLVVTTQMHIGRFCLSRMNACEREVLIASIPLKVLRIYLFWPYQHFFMDAANKVWGRLSGEDFTWLLHIIICQKILALWKDFHYVDLLRQFWHGSPDHLKQYVEGTDIFETLVEIVKNGFNPKDAPTYLCSYFRCSNDN
ncbi:uncharacterized protein TNIN_341301 [Trichonephila inaurata madagascariensis]|uniref:Uncharacterized protein n=1 Tax=Trichonephila inaurata madagascariensis TaxID=2747483 RepID=A0A8X6XT34_9ARAC|nr:uncharacterized protein TNIN_341301 [Trichonephila inaurata madagascariensis]